MCCYLPETPERRRSFVEKASDSLMLMEDVVGSGGIIERIDRAHEEYFRKGS